MHWLLLLMGIILLTGCLHPTDKQIALEQNEALLCQLDSMIARRDSFILEKEQHILEIKLKLAQANKEEEQHECLHKLYWNYRVYDADSAMKYTLQNLSLAQRYRQEEWEAEAMLDLGFIYTAGGLLDQASKVMKQLQRKELSRAMKSRYYGQMRTLCSRMQLYAHGDAKLQTHYGNLYACYSDSILMVATPDEPRLLYSKVWKAQDNPEERKKVIQEMVEKEKQLSADSRNYSILTYNLASLYEKEGEMVLWLRYMILSGMADVRAVNRDIGSLHAVASYLYDHGDLERAYTYCTYLQQIGTAYKSRVRLLHLAELQNRIQQSYIQRDHEQAAELKQMLLMISLMSAVLAVTLFFLYRQTRKRREINRLLHITNGQLRESNHKLNESNRKLNETNEMLNESNRKLNESNEMLNESNRKLNESNEMLNESNRKLNETNLKLKEVNGELMEANGLKEEYIGQVFKLCSTYLRKMEEQRKKLNRKMKAGQIEELRQILENSMTDSQEMKAFYEIFDAIILNLYPHFVEEINSLLRKEEHIDVKEGRLNTELRIQALIRLGVTDSEKIAEFLHCSVQTVYNNRSMTVAKAMTGKEEFLQAVKGVGKKTAS